LTPYDHLRALCDLLLNRIGTEGHEGHVGHEEFNGGKGAKKGE